jgi:hypothetical protein
MVKDTRHSRTVQARSTTLAGSARICFVASKYLSRQRVEIFGKRQTVASRPSVLRHYSISLVSATIIRVTYDRQANPAENVRKCRQLRLKGSMRHYAL